MVLQQAALSTGASIRFSFLITVSRSTITLKGDHSSLNTAHWHSMLEFVWAIGWFGPALILFLQIKQAFSLVNFVWHRSSEPRHIFHFASNGIAWIERCSGWAVYAWVGRNNSDPQRATLSDSCNVYMFFDVSVLLILSLDKNEA